MSNKDIALLAYREICKAVDEVNKDQDIKCEYPGLITVGDETYTILRFKDGKVDAVVTGHTTHFVDPFI